MAQKWPEGGACELDTVPRMSCCLQSRARQEGTERNWCSGVPKKEEIEAGGGALESLSRSSSGRRTVVLGSETQGDPTVGVR